LKSAHIASLKLNDNPIIKRQQERNKYFLGHKKAMSIKIIL
jgi:predicted transcriptional regulator